MQLVAVRVPNSLQVNLPKRDGYQAGRDIKVQNHIASLKISPKKVEIYAAHDIKWLKLYFIFGIACLVVGFTQFLNEKFNIPILFFFIVDLFVFVSFSHMLLKILDKYNFKNAKFYSAYCDGVIQLHSHLNGKITNKIFEFYTDIWRVEYKKNIFGNGVLFFYLLLNDKPTKKVVIFELDAEARYVYDSFYDQERIKNFLEQKEQSNTII